MTPARDSSSASLNELLRTANENPIVQGFPEGAIVVFDEELRYVCAGGQGLSVVGLTPELIEGKTIFEVFPAEVSRVLEEPYRRVLRGEELHFDVHFGGRVFIHRIAPLKVPGHLDSPVGIGFALDVTPIRAVEASLRASQENLGIERGRLRSAEIVGHSGSWEWDLESGVITWSEGLFVLHGLDPVIFDEGFEQAASRVHPEDRHIVDAAMESCRRDEPVQYRYRVVRASDGEIRWFDSRASGVFIEGQLVRLVGAVSDITDRVSAENEVVEANNFMNAVLVASPDFTFITDVRTGAMIFGSKDRDLLGQSAEATKSLGGNVVEQLVHPDDQAPLRAMNAEAARLGDGEVSQLRYRLRDAEGEWRWMNRRVVAFRRDEAGDVIEVLGILRDITDVVNAEEQLVHDALHDTLTGLANRALLMDRLEAALSRASREGREIAVLFCDLDGFKNVNDSAGHAAGDAVLIETSHRLLGVIREGDTAARFGGDEFVLIVEPWNRPSIADASRDPSDGGDRQHFSLEVANRVARALGKPFIIAGVQHDVTVSVGVALGRPAPTGATGALNAVQLLEAADAAMYVAKNLGKNRVHSVETAND